EDYYKAIETHQLATMRGKLVSAEDDLRRSVIGRILCHLSLIKSEVEENFGIDFDNYFSQEVKNLKELEEDGLVRLSKENIEVTPLGRLFIRNIAMVFDNYLRQAEQKRFSKTI
ncbi:MAG: coproporphyrinogen III oxidase, partial [Blastocatellia bacterium]|nr:coproporphyrinogen III oxidase [Blastocatellia bacterium]